MTTTDVLDVRAKAKRAKRRRQIAYVLYLTLGILLFLVVWQVLSVGEEPWLLPFLDRSFLPGWINLTLSVVENPWRIVGWDQSPLFYDIPTPLNTVRHFWDNLWFSEGMKQRFVHSCFALTEGPDKIATAQLPDYCFGYFRHLLETTRNILIGAALGTIGGLSMGLGSLVFPKIAQVFTPVASFFGTAPIFIAAPFFVIWFGVEIPLLTTAGLVTFYTTLLMYFFSRRAAENISVGIVESALTLGGSPRSIFRWVYMPGTVPEIAGGFRIALAGAWGLGVLVEVLGIRVGGGHLIDAWRFQMGVLEAPAALVSLIMFFGVLAVVVDGILVGIIRFMTRWSEAGSRLGL